LTDRGLLRAVLVGFALLVAYRFLAAVATALLLLGTGLLLAVALSAPVEWLHRRKVPRPVAVVGISLSLSGAAGLAGYLLYPTLSSQARDLAFALPGAVSLLAERARDLANSVGIRVGDLEGISPSTLARAARRVLGGIFGLFGSLASLLAALVVVVFVPLYLAAMPEPVTNWAVRLFPTGGRGEARALLSELRGSLLGWLVGRLFSMAVVGALSTAALYAIGVPGALFLGIFTGLVCFVPFVGPVVSAVPPLVLALVGNPVDALWVAAAYVGIQQVESNLLTPLVMHKTASVHPVAVISAVTVAGSAFGLLGALLATPAAVVAGVLVDRLWFRRLEHTPGDDKL
jgi:predicted PurR-regulated permease PerM